MISGSGTAPSAPFLRVVGPEEVRPKPEVRSASIPQPPASEELTRFRQTIEGLDLSVPRSSALLVLAGGYLIDRALDLHHQAIAHAAPGTFRHDVSPGMKSAEATQAWMRDHASEHLAALRKQEVVTTPYEKADDLKQATQLAGAELDRATAVATHVGMPLKGRAREIFATASDALRMTTPREQQPDYLLGIDVMGAIDG